MEHMVIVKVFNKVQHPTLQQTLCLHQSKCPANKASHKMDRFGHCLCPANAIQLQNIQIIDANTLPFGKICHFE